MVAPSTNITIKPSSLIFQDVQVDLRSELQVGPQIVDQLSVDVNVAVAEERLRPLPVKLELDDARIFAEAASDTTEKVPVFVIWVHFEGQDVVGVAVGRGAPLLPGIGPLDARRLWVGVWKSCGGPELSHFISPGLAVEVRLKRTLGRFNKRPESVST